MNSPKQKKHAKIPQDLCVACGSCLKVCPRNAIIISHGCFAEISTELCIGCGLCKKACPASIIELEVYNEK